MTRGGVGMDGGDSCITPSSDPRSWDLHGLKPLRQQAEPSLIRKQAASRGRVAWAWRLGRADVEFRQRSRAICVYADHSPAACSPSRPLAPLLIWSTASPNAPVRA